MQIPQSLAPGTYISAPNHNYVLLNTELPEDDTVVAIEFYATAPDLVYLDVRDRPLGENFLDLDLA